MTEELTEAIKIKEPQQKTHPVESTEKPFVCKILLIGDAGVGKTCLLLRFANDSFSETYVTTIGIDFKIKTISLPNGVRVKLQVWDTAGQERFRNITKAYVRGSSAICIVYDVTSSSSFKNLTNHINPDVENPEVVKFVVGNKIEMEDDRQVTFEEAKKLADEKGYEFREVSAANDKGVSELFMSLAKAVYRKKNPGSAIGWSGSATKFFRK
ncbi:GTP-binding protein ypt2-like [Pecten maximus]|uniref:GTP-binding protein ypt2-like n=1 Tax=Pecten maximus TaxID=6579 RepID=UPI0014584FB8|nr:GTP-binding protein ypt2-like [Pecten maximus]